MGPRRLVQDLESLGDRLADDRLVADLYRALTNHALFKRNGETEGHLSLSWHRAAEIVNTARAAGVGASRPRRGRRGRRTPPKL